MQQRHQPGFSLVETLLLILVIAVIGFGGFYVWKTQHQSATPVTSPQNKMSSAKSSQQVSWETAKLSGEELAFSYPGSWKILQSGSGSSSTSGDAAGLTAPSGFSMGITTSNVGHPSFDAPQYVAFDQPVTFLGKPAYINYLSSSDSTQTSADLGGWLSSVKTNDFLQNGLFQTKNLSPEGYITVSFSKVGGKPIQQNELTTNPDIATAKKIIESMHYYVPAIQH